ncbi:MAG: TRAP transporter small permease [Mailhella sp.]|nr:TRAP transporter small permease [Mailhella sp.]MBQ3170516.1 TRAP transporter small permease [Mailhella sp.]
MKFLERLEDIIPMVMMVIMFVVLLIQTFFRYVLSNSLLWPEEVARYAFIALVYLGAGAAAREGRHLEISVAKSFFGEKVRRVIVVISSVLTVVFCALMAVWGFDMAMFVKESGQLSASIPVPTYIFYLPIFIGMVWMGLRTITYAHRVLKSDDQGK